ncbi:uncharacterized protein LOC143606914 [Bidens hawaiensis]|uniref:uncharacterized protein LOC143606914 n=1 Tax=Bidens hawaiensis TaxID=980011 RepID=UPI0040498CC5
MVQGDYTTQYGTTVKIQVEEGTDTNLPTRRFKRIYVCFGALKQGFKAIGRDLLGLDGAFMKGPFPGQTLSALGLDPNNGIYPISFAVVETENLSSWTWFLENLGDDLDLGPNSCFTFMSDRQKGLLPAIENLFPCAEHRFCVRHIHENFKATYRGKLYKDLLYKCAHAATILEFETTMDELKAFNPDAHLWLSNIHPKHWSKSHFSGRAVSDILINNMCEVFNGKIVEGRDMPIISALEYIREYLMRRIVNFLEVIDKSEGLLTPTATTELQNIRTNAAHYTVQWNGGDLYQVSGRPGKQRVVDLVKRTCTCRRWELTGIPCEHVVATIWNKALNGGGLVQWKAGLIQCIEWTYGDKFILSRSIQSMAGPYGQGLKFLQLLLLPNITNKLVDQRRLGRDQHLS